MQDWLIFILTVVTGIAFIAFEDEIKAGKVHLYNFFKDVKEQIAKKKNHLTRFFVAIGKQQEIMPTSIKVTPIMQFAILMALMLLAEKLELDRLKKKPI